MKRAKGIFWCGQRVDRMTRKTLIAFVEQLNCHVGKLSRAFSRAQRARKSK